MSWEDYLASLLESEQRDSSAYAYFEELGWSRQYRAERQLPLPWNKQDSYFGDPVLKALDGWKHFVIDGRLGEKRSDRPTVPFTAIPQIVQGTIAAHEEDLQLSAPNFHNDEVHLLIPMEASILRFAKTSGSLACSGPTICSIFSISKGTGCKSGCLHIESIFFC